MPITQNPPDPNWSFTAPDTANPHKQWWWVVGFVAVMVSIAAWHFAQSDGFTAAAFLLSMGLYLYCHKGGEEHHEIAGFDTGIRIDNETFLPWNEIDAFSFIEKEEYAVVYFHLKRAPWQRVKLPLGETKSDWLRDKLSVHIPDKRDFMEPFLDRIIRIIGL